MKKVLALLVLASSSAFAQIAVPINSAGGGQVDVLSNGVRVIHSIPGVGASPQLNSTVQVLYEGKFVDGRVFDKSAQPIEFPLNRVIPCWTTGLQKMKVGETAKLECPAATAYGANGAGNTIPPNTPLNFTVKLLSIK
jgi:FKBP-type peptidyl-prolyl cis-trans isomerase FkpA